MATPVDAALAHVVATLAALAPIHEGLRDYTTLNLVRETKAEVASTLAAYDRRVIKLTALKTALEALIADGHPDLAAREISAAALKDLTDNAATIAAALKQFTASAPAATLGLTTGLPEPK